jgi:pantoate--beta-alanine ligase
MGYLHEGHLHLVRQAKADCGAVAVSIFVNPTQFGPNEDFATYPRDEERDLALLQAEGVAMVFLPSPDEMYPQPFYTAVEVETITTQLEGAARPGHFRGVATIVAKLLNIVQPDRTYFGQKDAQQTIVIRRMVHDLNIPGEMVVVPTVREPDGLAMSSRNTYLAPDERQAATILYRALLAAQERYKQGERNGEVLRGVLHEVLASEPLARVEYVSAAHPHTLQEQQQITNAGVLLSLAVRIGKTRLIDNILLGTEANEHEKS